MKDVRKINNDNRHYKAYDVKRIEVYLKSKGNNKGNFPFYIKKQL